MSEKYYVVSESELENLKNEVFWLAKTRNSDEKDLEEAEAACRARPVVEINDNIWAKKEIVDRMMSGDDPT